MRLGKVWRVTSSGVRLPGFESGPCHYLGKVLTLSFLICKVDRNSAYLIKWIEIVDGRSK